MTLVLAYVPDLMDRSKVAAVEGVTIVARPEMLVDAEADVVVVDLTRPGVMEVLPHLRGRVVGFANHTNRELMQAARDAGCEVMARSAFFADIVGIISGPAPPVVTEQREADGEPAGD